MASWLAVTDWNSDFYGHARVWHADCTKPGMRKNMQRPRKTTGLRPKSNDCPRTNERRVVLDALTRHGWNTVRAARSIGVAHREFLRLLRCYGLRDAL